MSALKINILCSNHQIS